MIKAVALYRDGSKLSQPLNATLDENPELKKLLEEEKDEGVSQRITRKVTLGQRELLLHALIDENEQLRHVRVEMSGLTGVQEAMLTAVVNMINFSVAQGIDPVVLAQQALAIGGHPVIAELQKFVQEVGNGKVAAGAGIYSNGKANGTAEKIVVDEKAKCRSCGATQMRQNGTCQLCEVCGETSGCS